MASLRKHSTARAGDSQLERVAVCSLASLQALPEGEGGVMRVGLVGPPRCGKTTLAGELRQKYPEKLRIIHTDDFMPLPWEDVPWAIVKAAESVSANLVEGMQVPRAIRKGMVVDRLIAVETSSAELNKGQAAMWKGVQTVIASLVGVEVEWFETSDDARPRIMELLGLEEA